MPTGHLTDHRIREDTETATAAYHPVAVTPSSFWVTLRIRGSHGDVESGFGPELQDPVGMKLGSARLDINEITPGQHVNSLETRFRGERRYI